ncbi:ribonuclease HII [Glycocaulis profundi]|nr:ribonuclease HII [Glycocaulis profundi]
MLLRLSAPDHLTAGVDEAGRGPLAGPVVAAAVVLPSDFSAREALADSKTLTAKRREALAEIIWAEACVGVGIAEPVEIDRLNILHATMAAMSRAVERVLPCPLFALVDGNRLPRLPCPGEAVIGGDGTEPAISAASIIAKTVRDRIMTEACARHPGYGFARHKGYGGKAHTEALMRLGPSPIHRLSYAPVRLARENFTPMNQG